MKVSAAVLRDFLENIFTALEVSKPNARVLADSLVSANLRGVDSHGAHLVPYYVKQVKAGNIDPKANGRVIKESRACLLFDGEHGIGQHVSDVCCRHAVRLAQAYGLGMAVARNSNHFGAAAFWAMRLSEHGMIGMVMSNASPTVAPWQGKRGRVGTNPLCMSVPSSGAGGWLLDMATTTVALNKIVKAANRGDDKIPSGWAMDSEGVPTTDPRAALEGLLMPLGGYKGSGLTVLIEILCGVLSGGAMSTAVGGVHIFDRPMNTSQVFLAIDTSCFLPLPEFQSRMEHLVTTLKSTPPAHGYEEVLVAGDPEWRIESLRLQEGIPIDAGLWRRLAEVAAELGVSLP